MDMFSFISLMASQHSMEDDVVGFVMICYQIPWTIFIQESVQVSFLWKILDWEMMVCCFTAGLGVFIESTRYGTISWAAWFCHRVSGIKLQISMRLELYQKVSNISAIWEGNAVLVWLLSWWVHSPNRIIVNNNPQVFLLGYLYSGSELAT
jgi:hypothetical protein